MTKGLIFSIEEFAINDGPGIRKTIFMKGCPLRCAWCHNPEGLQDVPQIMHGRDGDEICGYYMSSEELAASLLKDRDFYAMNNGGVTFTGGEPTMQPEFLIEVLRILKGKVHTAIETSGFCKESTFEKIISLTDYILYDIKATDPLTHKQYTGVSNHLIIQNLHSLIKSKKPFVIRIPLIPGVNDSLEAMEAVRELVKDAESLQRVELLRYHKTAGAKYSKVDMEYNPPFDTETEPHVYNIFEKSIVL